MLVELNISDDTGGFVFEDFVNQEDIDALRISIKAKIDKQEKINLYFEDDNVEDIDISAFFDQVLFDISHADSLKKIAIVTNRKWIHGATRIKNLLTSTDVRAFESKERIKALCWIMGC